MGALAGTLVRARSLSRASVLVIVAAVLGGTQAVLGLLEAPTAVRITAAVLVVGVAVASEADKVQTRRREDRQAEQKEEEAQKAAEVRWTRQVAEALRVWPLQPISDVDPYHLGVKQSSLADKFKAAGQQLPPYVARDKDKPLRQQLQQRGLVLIVGAPASGATRTAFEAALDAGDHRLVLAPRPPDGLRRALDELDVLSRLAPDARIVVWLDGIDRFGDGGVTAVMLQEVRGRVSGSRVVATIPGSRYRTWVAEESELAAQFSEPVVLERLSSVEEKSRAAALYPGVDASQGIAAAFTAVGSLLVRLQGGNADCPHEPVGGDCPIARAIVAVAAGWAATGTSRGLTTALLPKLVQQLYGLPNPPTAEHLSTAMAWAQALTVEGASLVRQPPGVTTSDSVEANHELSNVLAAQQPPPWPVWGAALNEAAHAEDSEAIGRIGFQAHVVGNFDVAQDAWAAIETPDEPAAAWLRRAAEYSRNTHDAHAELPPRQRLIELLERVRGADAHSIAADLYALGLVHRDMKRLDVARELFERSLRIEEREHGPDHLAVAAPLNGLGDAWASLGRPDAACEPFERALLIEEREYGPDHSQVARTLASLGSARQDRGQPEAARELLERALRIQERAYGPDHLQVAHTLVGLGSVWRDLGQPARALELIERALVIEEREYGPEHVRVATTLDNLGAAWGEMGRPDLAREPFAQALRIKERAYGPDHPDVAITLGNLGSVWLVQEEPKPARELLERALRIQEREYGPAHPRVSLTLGNLGSVLLLLGQPKPARELLERALRIQEREYGPAHPRVTFTLVNLGTALRQLGHPSRSREMLERAVQIGRHSLPDRHPLTARAISELRVVAPDVIVARQANRSSGDS